MPYCSRECCIIRLSNPLKTKIKQNKINIKKVGSSLGKKKQNTYKSTYADGQGPSQPAGAEDLAPILEWDNSSLELKKKKGNELTEPQAKTSVHK